MIVFTKTFLISKEFTFILLSLTSIRLGTSRNHGNDAIFVYSRIHVSFSGLGNPHFHESQVMKYFTIDLMSLLSTKIDGKCNEEE